MILWWLIELVQVGGIWGVTASSSRRRGAYHVCACIMDACVSTIRRQTPPPNPPTPPHSSTNYTPPYIPERVNGTALELPACQARPVRRVLEEEGGLPRRLGDAAARRGNGPAACQEEEQEWEEQEASTAGASLPPLLWLLLWWLHGWCGSGAWGPDSSLSLRQLQRQAIEKEAAALAHALSFEARDDTHGLWWGFVV